MAQASSYVDVPGVMNPELYLAVTKNELANFKLMQDKSRDQRTMNQDTVLHLASMFGHAEMVKEILGVHGSLLRKTNVDGNTALHLAARGGHLDVVVTLLQNARSLPNIGKEEESLLQSQNNLLDTALHLAVCGNHKDVVKRLVIEDPHYQYDVNGHLQTPLYLASLRGFKDIVEIILNNCESPTFDGPGEKTALHAAVTYTDSNGLEIVKLLLRDHKDLVDRRDEGGETALHLVAYNNLSMIVDDLVDAKSYVGYLKNGNGLTPLHVAAFVGNVDVMKKLLQHYPDLWNVREALQDKSDMNRNILHIAIAGNRKEAIQFILSLQGCKELLLQEDSYGDTPLHYVAGNGCYVEELMNFGELDWKRSNFKNITPLDILLDGTVKDPIGDQELIRNKLNANDEFWHLGQREHAIELEQKLKNFKNEEKRERHEKELEKIKNTIGIHMVVAALTGTVSLTAGFAMPGGFDGNEGSTQGYAVLAKKPAFRVFMVADTFTLFLSVCALSLYFMSTVQMDVCKARRSFFFAVMLNLISLISLVVAFIAATYSVLIKPSRELAISLCFISSLALVIIIVPLICLAVPYKWYKHGYKHVFWPNKLQRLLM